MLGMVAQMSSVSVTVRPAMLPVLGGRGPGERCGQKGWNPSFEGTCKSSGAEGV